MSRTIKIGRSSDNDYVINDPTVSRHHALLTVSDDKQSGLLRDLDSGNGTQVNGVKIKKETPVNANSQLKFGNTVVTLSSIVNHTVVKPINNDPNTKVIGRGSECQIRFSQDDVSQRHAILSCRVDGSVYIQDCNSTNGTFVNGNRITSQQLKSGDIVTITQNYRLDWEKYFPFAKPAPKFTQKRALVVAAALVAVVAVCFGIFKLSGNKIWGKEKIYEQYSDAVCMVIEQHGYKVLLGGEDITADLCRDYLKITPSEYIYVDQNHNIKPVLGDGSETNGGQGTAFFISNDGKLVTNLHVTRHWLFSHDEEIIEQKAKEYLSLLAAAIDPRYNSLKIEVEKINSINIVPNGLPITPNNAIACQEIKANNDVNKDVAIIQTENRTLPAGVKHIVDLGDINTGEEAIKEGQTIFTIGYPLGTNINLNSNMELKNQIHEGSVTQNMGAYEFGHDAATTHGASGSPIFNDKGELIGIVSSGVDGTQGFNYAVKAKCILELINK